MYDGRRGNEIYFKQYKTTKLLVIVQPNAALNILTIKSLTNLLSL
jgi:hypothetical protein